VRKKTRQSRSNIKVMMIVFFDLDGIVLAEFVPRNTTVNSEYYKGLFERLRNDMRRKRPEKFLLRLPELLQKVTRTMG
jgi:hypothetical protein